MYGSCLSPTGVFIPPDVYYIYATRRDVASGAKNYRDGYSVWRINSLYCSRQHPGLYTLNMAEMESLATGTV